MADEKIVIDVEVDVAKVAADLNSVTVSLSDLRNEQKELKKEIEAGNDATGELSKAYALNDTRIKELTASQKALTGQLQTTDKENRALGDSFREMDAYMRQLENEYKSLTKAQRESAEGQKLKKELIEQKEALKQMDAELGNHQRDVGNYEKAMGSLGGKLKSAREAMKALWANPWVAIVGALALAVKKLIDAFKGSEERMNELRTAFAPLKGIADLVKQGFDALAKTVGEGLTKALDLAMRSIKWVAAALDRIGNWMGKEWGLSAALEKAAENTRKLTAAEQQYTKHSRQFVTDQAKVQNEIAKLRDKVAQKDKYTADERLRMLEQMQNKEKWLASERKKLAEENLAAIEAEAARSENDAEMNDKLAQAKAAVIEADTAYFELSASLEKQMAKTRAEIEAEIEAEKKRAQEELNAADAEAAAAQNAAEKERLAREKQDAKLAEERERAQQEADEYLRSLHEQTLDDMYADELAALQAYYDDALITTEEFEAARAEIEEQYRQAKQMKQAEDAQMYLDSISALNDAINQVENAALARFEQGQEQRKKALDKRLKAGEISQEKYEAEVAKLDEETERKKIEIERQQAIREKALGIMNATISTAQAIIKAMADPGGFAGIALSALAGATGAAQIAAIAAQPLPQFATGGIVGGNSYSGDAVLARLNSGEMVLNQESQQRLFDALSSDNGKSIGFDYEMMAAAVAAQPAPVVVYKELQDFGDKVTTYNEIAAV